MRAEVERNNVAGTDAYGHPLPASFVPLGTYPCFAWSRQSRAVVDGGKTALVEDLRAIFPRGTDIREGDEIVRITDRKWVEIVAGRLRVDATPQAKTRHLEVALKRVN